METLEFEKEMIKRLHAIVTNEGLSTPFCVYHKYFWFRNGYILSVVKGMKDKGFHSGESTFEVALLKHVFVTEDGKSRGTMVKKGPFKDDVLGWQTVFDILKLSERVNAWNPVQIEVI